MQATITIWNLMERIENKSDNSATKRNGNGSGNQFDSKYYLSF